MRRIILAALILLCMSTSAFAAGDSTGSNTNAIIGDKVQPMQGNCGATGAPGSTAQSGLIDPKVSVWSCPGISTSPLSFSYHGDQQEGCLYIDNLTTNKSYFVPMRTYNEWMGFKNATLPGPNGSLNNKVRITYGCQAQTVSDTCGGTVSLPADRNGAQRIITTSSGKRLTFTCGALNGCGTWAVTSSTGQCSTNGACGSAHGSILVSAPTSNLCTTGTPTAISGSGPWFWSCNSTNGGNPMDCSAQAMSSSCNPSTTPANIVLVLDASGSMQPLVNAAKAGGRKIATDYLINKPDITLSVVVLGGSGYTRDMSAAGRSSCPIGRILGPGFLTASAFDNALGPISATSSTPLAEAINFSKQFVTGKSNPAIIVLSDGDETCTGNVGQAIQTAKGEGIKVFGVAYGSYNSTTFGYMDHFSPATNDAQVLAALDNYIGRAVCGPPISTPIPNPPPPRLSNCPIDVPGNPCTPECSAQGLCVTPSFCTGGSSTHNGFSPDIMRALLVTETSLAVTPTTSNRCMIGARFKSNGCSGRSLSTIMVAGGGIPRPTPPSTGCTQACVDRGICDPVTPGCEFYIPGIGCTSSPQACDPYDPTPKAGCDQVRPCPSGEAWCAAQSACLPTGSCPYANPPPTPPAGSSGVWGQQTPMPQGCNFTTCPVGAGQTAEPMACSPVGSTCNAIDTLGFCVRYTCTAPPSPPRGS